MVPELKIKGAPAGSGRCSLLGRNGGVGGDHVVHGSLSGATVISNVASPLTSA